MIGVAINENVVLVGAQLATNRESLEISFEEVKEQELNLFEQSMQEGIQDVGASGPTKIRVWCFKAPNNKNADGTEKTREEKLKRVNDEMTERKNQLLHIMSRYLTGTLSFDKRQYDGTGINGSNYTEMWLDNNALKEVFTNVANQFIEELTPFFGKRELKSRLKLLRQSADKHFPTFPGGRYIKDNPFYEPMEVPKDASKVKFSKYEIEKGLTSNEVPDKNTEADPVPDATPDVSDSVFGAR